METSLLLAGFFRHPESLQFGGQLRFGCRTYCFLLGLRGRFDRTRRWFSSSKVRPPWFLSSRNFLFRSNAHSPVFLSCSSGISWRTEDTAQLFIQILDLFFNRSSPLELVNRKVERIHGSLGTIQSWWKSSAGQMYFPVMMSLIFAQVITLKQPDSLSDPLFHFGICTFTRMTD
ncbi:MAG TPA: hypothetical protein VJ521_13260, partial [Acidobacteriota bacterium]|nr:hypothetical protein [Acidobacteriota bacterium]